MVESKWTASKGRYPYHEGKHLIMVLELHAYGDESGINLSDPYCMIGGFVASPRQWTLFKREWREVLDREGVNAFHAVEFFDEANWLSRTSPYYQWTTQRASKFLDDLLLILDGHPRIHDVGGLVNNADFSALDQEQRKLASGGWRKVKWDFPGGNDLGPTVVEQDTFGGAEVRSYPVSFFQFVKQTLRHVPDGALVHFTFDIQNLEEGLARQNYARMIKQKMEGWEKLGGLTYDRSELHEPLQAADLYAYIVTHWVARDGKVSPARFRAAMSLIGKRRQKLEVRDAAAFREDDKLVRTQIIEGIMQGITKDKSLKLEWQEGKPPVE